MLSTTESRAVDTARSVLLALVETIPAGKAAAYSGHLLSTALELGRLLQREGAVDTSDPEWFFAAVGEHAEHLRGVVSGNL